MAQHLLNKFPAVKSPYQADRLLTELEPETRQLIREAKKDLIQPRPELIERILKEAMRELQH